MKYEEIFDKLKFNKLTEVQDKIIDKNKNLLIISNCGSGKTEASYFKMLENNKKTIFIEPMTTLANSIKDRCNCYNKQLGLEQVTIQHSLYPEDKFLQGKYCVTTIDQVLSGYLAIGKQAYIKGKNVLMSNLIFDEVQLFDSNTMLLTTINMLDEINKIGNKFIIMTATMPTYLINLLKDRYDMDIVISENNRDERQVKLYYEDDLDYNKIEEYTNKQIIICNSVKQCIDVYCNLPKDRVIVLNSLFLKEDRKKIENDLDKYFGKHSKNNNKILLTTSIVEVGMDISADRVYSTSCPIDNLVQRDGRCCRWGGEGEVIVFENTDKIHDIEVVENTINHIKQFNGISFTWDIQKLWVNNILNSFYENKINDSNLKANKINFKGCNKNKLIRDIQNVNLIVCNKDEYSKSDFNRQSINIHINKLKNISETNELYVLDKNNIVIKQYFQIESGDTVIIRGNNCIYDELGFRYENDLFVDNSIDDFPIKHKSHIDFDDYVEESWIHHALDVRSLFKEQLKKDMFNEYIIKNLDKISFYGGLHDLGKLDVEWSKKYTSDIPLAHFPFVRGVISERRTHELISGNILKKYINDNIIYNMIIQHHKRLYNDRDIEYIVTKFNLHKDTYNILKEYGFSENIELNGSESILKRKDIITPKNNEWTTLLYLVGTFMECEILSISNFIKKAIDR